jgi:hypothetical protein
MLGASVKSVSKITIPTKYEDICDHDVRDEQERCKDNTDIFLANYKLDIPYFIPYNVLERVIRKKTTKDESSSSFFHITTVFDNTCDITH